MRRAMLGGLVLVGCVVAAPAARADADERRVSATGVLAVVIVDDFGAVARPLAVGGGVTVGHGMRDWLELSIAGGYLVRPDARLERAVVDGVAASDLAVFADLHAATLLAAARLQLVRGRPAILARVHPVLELRFGLAARWLARPQAFDERGALVADLADAWAVEPRVGAGVGAVFRWTDAVEVGALIIGFSNTRARIAAGLAVEISWRSYDLF